jgi:hypothetical protein
MRITVIGSGSPSVARVEQTVSRGGGERCDRRGDRGVALPCSGRHVGPVDGLDRLDKGLCRMWAFSASAP